MSNDPDQEFFSDGISEELLNVLAKMPGLRVAARTSSFQFKGKNPNISEIGRTLGVDHVLEGSVRKAGTRLRITAQLIDVGTGFHLWSETYDRELTDIFAIQDEISAAIAKALKLYLGGAEEGMAGSGEAAAPITRVAHTTTPGAYEEFLLGRHLINRRTEAALQGAVGHFEAVLAIDPGYAPAWAALGEAIILLENAPCCYGKLTREEVIARAGPALEQALKIDPDLAEAWAPLGMLRDRMKDNEGALAAYDRAIEINPNLARAHMWRAIILSGKLGRLREGFEAEKRALELDPLNLSANANHARALADRGRFAEAEPFIERLTQLSPARGHQIRGELLRGAGEHAQAILWLHRAHAEVPASRRSYVLLGLALMDLGLHGPAEMALGDYRYVALTAQGRHGEAVAAARDRFFNNPRSNSALLDVAEALFAAGDYEGALKQLRRLFQIAPDYPRSRFGLQGGLLYPHLLRRNGEAESAAGMLRKIAVEIESRRNQGPDYFGLHIGETQILAQERLFDDAAVALERLVGRGWLTWRNFPLAVPDAFLQHPGYLAALVKMEAERARERGRLAEIFCAPGLDIPETEIRTAICAALAAS